MGPFTSASLDSQTIYALVEIYKSKVRELQAQTNQKPGITDLFAQHTQSCVIAALEARDKLESQLSQESRVDATLRVQVADEDKRFRLCLNRALLHVPLDFEGWRAVKSRQTGEELPWWWQVDSERYGAMRRMKIDLRTLVYAVTSMMLILVSLYVVAETSTKLAQFFLRLFISVDANQLGLDIITVLAVGVQVFLGGQVSLAFVGRVTNAINSALANKRSPLLRPMAIRLLPVTGFFVGTLIFLTIVYFIGTIAIPVLAAQLRRSADQIEQPPTSVQSTIETAHLLDPDVDYPFELMRLGLRYETAGDNQRARTLYERALSSAPSMVYIAHRLSSMYLEQYASDSSLLDTTEHILDYAIALVHSDVSPDDLRLRGQDQVTQMEFLLLVNRAELYLSRESPFGALVDLEAALNLVRNHSNLFVTRANKDNPDPSSISTTKLSYLLSKTYFLLYQTTDDPQFLTEAEMAYVELVSVADSARSGRDRRWTLEIRQLLEQVR